MTARAVVFRVYWRQCGGHVHCRLFVVPDHRAGASALAGELVFRVEEWAGARDALARGGAIIAEDGAAVER